MPESLQQPQDELPMTRQEEIARRMSRLELVYWMCDDVGDRGDIEREYEELATELKALNE